MCSPNFPLTTQYSKYTGTYASIDGRSSEKEEYVSDDSKTLHHDQSICNRSFDVDVIYDDIEISMFFRVCRRFSFMEIYAIFQILKKHSCGFFDGVWRVHVVTYSYLMAFIFPSIRYARSHALFKVYYVLGVSVGLE